MAHIVVVDDEEAMRRVMEMMLATKGYQVTVLLGGKEAKTYLKSASSSIDLVIMDLYMPDENALSVLTELQDAPICRNNTPILLLSGIHEGEDIEKAKALGVKEHLPKPFDMITFLATVEKLLSTHA